MKPLAKMAPVTTSIMLTAARGSRCGIRWPKMMYTPPPPHPTPKVGRQSPHRWADDRRGQGGRADHDEGRPGRGQQDAEHIPSQGVRADRKSTRLNSSH